MDIFDHPRYKENPANLLFEQFILDVIGCLATDKIQSLEQMDLPRRFNTRAKDWRGAIVEILQLSPTIKIAILDLWYRNREIGKKQGVEYEPIQFAMDFVDHYYEEGSRIDVWEGNALEDAKTRIAKHRHFL